MNKQQELNHEMAELFLKGYNVSDIFKYCLSMLNTERIISLMKETYNGNEYVEYLQD